MVVYWNFGTNQQPGERLEAVISTDGGQSFGSPNIITFAIEYNEPAIRTGSFLPSAAADRTTQNIYVVYQTLLGGNPRIAFTRSTNGGTNWSAPVAISDNPAGSGVFNPAINVSADGRTVTAPFMIIGITPAQMCWLIFTWRNLLIVVLPGNPISALLLYQLMLRLLRLRPTGYMLGDYLGVAQTTRPTVPAVPIWVDTRTGNPDPFITRAGIAPYSDLGYGMGSRARIARPSANDVAVVPRRVMVIATAKIINRSLLPGRAQIIRLRSCAPARS